MRRQEYFWNEEVSERLRVMWAAGETSRIIGEKLGATSAAVINRAHRMGLPKRKDCQGFAVPHANREQARELVAARLLNDGEISRIVGMSRDGIRLIRRGMGFAAVVQRGAPKKIHTPDKAKAEVQRDQPEVVTQAEPRRKIQPVLNLSKFQCVFLIGDEKPWSACPDNAIKGRQYCLHHMDACYWTWRRPALVAA